MTKIKESFKKINYVKVIATVLFVTLPFLTFLLGLGLASSTTVPATNIIVLKKDSTTVTPTVTPAPQTSITPAVSTTVKATITPTVKPTTAVTGGLKEGQSTLLTVPTDYTVNKYTFTVPAGWTVTAYNNATSLEKYTLQNKGKTLSMEIYTHEDATLVPHDKSCVVPYLTPTPLNTTFLGKTINSSNYIKYTGCTYNTQLTLLSSNYSTNKTDNIMLSLYTSESNIVNSKTDIQNIISSVK